jgi:quinoprotein dehydrogenase-associated probable ABC transporter substrate-binding protein
MLAVLVALPAAALADAPAAHAPHAPRTLRVCADPNNYPFTRERGDGFENRIAAVLAKELGARVEYTWHAQRRGFFRETLKAKTCDVVLGVPVGLGMARTTRPYYRSSYVFVTRRDRKLGDLRSLDDPRLKTLTIGVPLAGDDGNNPPPEHALARRGIVDNVRGFSLYGDYREDAPPAALVRAVERGDVDVAIAWGPLAGAFAKRAHDLRVTPIAEASDDGVPLAFAIALGVRKPDSALAAELDRALAARAAEIDAILDAYGVPRLPIDPGDAGDARDARAGKEPAR